MNYCSNCGAKTQYRIPKGDNRQRHICNNCGMIHYQNPKIIAGCVILEDDEVLLCRRAIQPRCGLWTLPAGFMENGETVAQAALRETWEEAQARPELDSLYVVTSIPKISQVYMLYLGYLHGGGFSSGPESLEVNLFSMDKIPWGELAFHTVEDTLRCLREDLKCGSFPLHCIERKEAQISVKR